MKPIVTEKAVMFIETKNTLVFELDKRMTKTQIKSDLEKIFKIKIDKINTSIRNNHKYAHVKLNKDYPAIDIATKLGVI